MIFISRLIILDSFNSFIKLIATEEFCSDMLSEFGNYTHFIRNIIFTDEAALKLNRHYAVYWGIQNMHVTIQTELNAPDICIWGGISWTGMIGPFIFDGAVIGENFFNMLVEHKCSTQFL
jgi:hypothetical protein